MTGRLRRRVEIRTNSTVDELHRRRTHTSGSVQHGTQCQITDVLRRQSTTTGSFKQRRLDNSRTSEESVVHQGQVTLRCLVLRDLINICTALCLCVRLSVCSSVCQGCICQILTGGGQSFDWRLATIAGMEVAKLVPWNSLLN